MFSLGPSIYDVHTEGVRGSGSGGRMWMGEWSSPMWTSTQKIKIKSPLTSYCLLLMQRSWRRFYQNFVFGQKQSGLSCLLVNWPGCPFTLVTPLPTPERYQISIYIEILLRRRRSLGSIWKHLSGAGEVFIHTFPAPEKCLYTLIWRRRSRRSIYIHRIALV